MNRGPNLTRSKCYKNRQQCRFAQSARLANPFRVQAVLWMSLTQGSRCAANPGLSKSSPSGNRFGPVPSATEPVISLRWMKRRFLIQSTIAMNMLKIMCMIPVSALSQRGGLSDRAGNTAQRPSAFAGNLSPTHRLPRRGDFSQPRVAASAATRGTRSPTEAEP